MSRTYERRRIAILVAPQHAGIDFSIPDHTDHHKHVADVLRASPRGFPWLVFR